MAPLSMDPHRCAGCGGWSMGWCGTCRMLHNREAAAQALQQAHADAEGRAHRVALEAALPGTGYQHRPSAASATPQRGDGAHTSAA